MPPRVDKEQAGRSDASIKRKTHREVERHGGWLIRVAYPITRCLTVFGGRQTERPNR